MKKLVLAALMIMTAALCFAKDPCEGYWISYDDKTGQATAGWEITIDAKGNLTGKIIHNALEADDVLAFDTKGKGPYDDFPVPGDMYKMPVVGTPWIYNMKNDGEGKWSGGKVVDPQSGNRYKCKITFHKAGESKKYPVDTLEMRGELGAGIGRSQYWKAATKEEAMTISSK
ncbi:MAG: DUF2147 domain-containing protein [Treponema sp.]|nr:DUF2147 domain-containing protein [Treponema sp.]